jgi:hypothetical protein
MLYDDMNERPEANGPAPQRERASKPSADREVELPIARRTTPASVHAWLDGDLPEAAVRHGDTARDVEFWNRLNRDITVRRQMQTPAYMIDRIMESLPEASPSETAPWWRKPFGLSPMMIVAIAAGMFALGLAAATLIR